MWGGEPLLACDSPLHFSGLFRLLESSTWVGPQPFLSQGLMRWFSLLPCEILFLLSLLEGAGATCHDTRSYVGTLGHPCLCQEPPSVFFLGFCSRGGRPTRWMASSQPTLRPGDVWVPQGRGGRTPHPHREDHSCKGAAVRGEAETSLLSRPRGPRSPQAHRPR